MKLTSITKKFLATQGVGKLTLTVFGALSIALVWSGFQVIPFFYSYYELENQMDALARMADEYTDAEIRKKLLVAIKELEIPVEADDLKISRYDDKIFINLDYSEVFYLTIAGKDYTIQEFDFSAKASRQVYKPKGPKT